MKAFTILAVGTLSTLSAGVSIAQSGHMMDGGGWMWGYGGAWWPIVFVVIVALAVWAFWQHRK